VLLLRNERVVSFSINYNDVFWEIEPTTEDVQQYEFYVERSEAEAGPWDTIAGPLIDQYMIRDNAVHAITTNARTLFYRVRCRHVPTDRVVYSATFDREGSPNILATEMIRLERVLFEEFVGVRCWLFPRRSFGQRCPNCYDSVLGKTVDTRCPTCWGTGFSGGYHYPTAFWAQIDPVPEAEQVSSEDHRRVQMAQLRCGPSPAIKPLDLVIDHQNRRFRVVESGGTSMSGVRVRAEVKMVLIQKGSIEDKIPLKVDTSTVVLSPRRNFQNAQSQEASKASEFDAFSLYGVRS
jgi:hypothetical protein